MGWMRFQLPEYLPGEFDADLLRSTIGSGLDRSPTICQTEILNRVLHVRNEIAESGPVFVPIDIGAQGQMMGVTSTLLERAQPYHLGVELARGKINQLRNQYADWVAGGLTPVPEVEQLLEDATKQFGQAIAHNDLPEVDEFARKAIEIAGHTAQKMAEAYTKKVYQLRHLRFPKLESHVGVRLGKVPTEAMADVVRLSFNSVTIPMPWRLVEPQKSSYNFADIDATIEWATQRQLHICAGPLIDFSEYGLPDFVLKDDVDAVTMKSLMCDFVETMVKRYKGQVNRWTITSGFNGATSRGFNEEDLISLSAIASDAAWQIDPGLVNYLGVSRSFSEYTSMPGFDYSAFVYADTLLRAGLPYKGIELEWFMGSRPRGSYMRDLIDCSKNLDLFSLLGIDIQVAMSYPSANTDTPVATPGEKIERSGCYRTFSEEAQADVAEHYAALALCKSFVNGFIWDNLDDRDWQRMPNGGLIDREGKLKPAFDRLRQLREEHFK